MAFVARMRYSWRRWFGCSSPFHVPPALSLSFLLAANPSQPATRLPRLLQWLAWQVIWDGILAGSGRPPGSEGACC